MINDYYLVFRNNLGIVDAVNKKETGQSLPLPLDEDDPLTIELRSLEEIHGQLDLSDRPPEPQPEVIGYRLNKLLSFDRNIPMNRFPGDINYNTELTIGLVTQTIDYIGLRVAQVFRQTIDPETKEPIAPVDIVFEEYEYNWDETLKRPNSRVKKIYFYLENGERSLEYKILPKEFYSSSDKNDIVYYRRQTIVNWFIARAGEIGLGTLVNDFFALYKDATDKYILYGDRALLDIIENAEEQWLEAQTGTVHGTVRQSILFFFNKALEATPSVEITAYLESL